MECPKDCVTVFSTYSFSHLCVYVASMISSKDVLVYSCVRRVLSYSLGHFVPSFSLLGIDKGSSGLP